MSVHFVDAAARVLLSAIAKLRGQRQDNVTAQYSPERAFSKTASINETGPCFRAPSSELNIDSALLSVTAPRDMIPTRRR